MDSLITLPSHDNGQRVPMDEFEEARLQVVDEIFTTVRSTASAGVVDAAKPLVNFVTDVAARFVRTGVVDPKAGITGLACIYSMLKNGFHEIQLADEVEPIIKYFRALNHYFFWEKVSDDIAEYDPLTGQFTHYELVRDFNSLAIRVVKGEEFDIWAEVDRLNTDDVTTDIDKLISLNIEILPNFKIKAALAYNLLSLQELVRQTHENWGEIAENFQGSMHIYDFLIDALIRRYDTNNKIMAKEMGLGIQEPIDPDELDIARNLRWGKDTILTDTFISYALCLITIALESHRDPRNNTDSTEKSVIGIELEKPEVWKDLIDAVSSMSYLIRILNDVGPAALFPTEAKAKIELLRRKFGKDVSPRDLFEKVEKISNSKKLIDGSLIKSPADLNLLSRFLKDAKEKEYNTIFNSGVDIDTPPEYLWGNFYFNIYFASDEYRTHLERFLVVMSRFSSELYPLYDFFLRFLDANMQLYATMGDYDKKAMWLEMRAMRDSANSIFTVHDKILENLFENLPKTS